MVAKDKKTILRVEPYQHWVKNALRPYVSKGSPVFLPHTVKKEKKYYATGTLYQSLNSRNSELCRRVHVGTSMKAASLEELLEFFATNKDKLATSMETLEGWAA
eukprot:3990277-Karenia_brevis.AAC.1